MDNANQYGVYTNSEEGSIVWLVDIMLQTTGKEIDALKNMSMIEAMQVATYLNSQGGESVYSFGRPDDRHPK